MEQVIIIGAGPAGAYLAYLLADCGIRVRLLEKESLPRQKPCGGAISPKVIRLLDFDPAPVLEDSINKVIFTHGLSRPIVIDAKQPVVHMVDRKYFDAFLVDKAKEAGAGITEKARVNKVEIKNDRVSVHAGDREWQGRVVVGADGAVSRVARTLGVFFKNNAVTQETEIPVSTETLSRYRGTVNVDYGLIPSGYAWVFPKANHLSVGVGSTSSKVKNLGSYLKKLLEAQDLSDLPAETQERRWLIPFRSQIKSLHGDRTLVIGDAAGLADAFTGEGIYAAVYSAHLAAQVIMKEINKPQPDFRKYTELVKKKMGAEVINAYRVNRLLYPVSGIVHKLMQHRHGLAEDLLEVIAGDMTYKQFSKSLPKVIRS